MVGERRGAPAAGRRSPQAGRLPVADRHGRTGISSGTGVYGNHHRVGGGAAAVAMTGNDIAGGNGWRGNNGGGIRYIESGSRRPAPGGGWAGPAGHQGNRGATTNRGLGG